MAIKIFLFKNPHLSPLHTTLLHLQGIFFSINVMQCQSAWYVIKWSIHLDPPGDETTAVEEDRGRSCQTMYPSLFLHQPLLLALSLFLFLSRWLRRQPSSPFNLSAYNLPTFLHISTYLPNYWSSRKKREGNLSIQAMRILRSASIYDLRNVLSSFILVRLFSRIVNENNRASRCAQLLLSKDCQNSAILQLRECLNLSSYDIWLRKRV